MMATWEQPYCVGNNGACNKEANKMIFMGNKAYPICDKCYEWLGKIGQLILEDWKSPPKEKE